MCLLQNHAYAIESTHEENDIKSLEHQIKSLNKQVKELKEALSDTETRNVLLSSTIDYAIKYISCK